MTDTNTTPGFSKAESVESGDFVSYRTDKGNYVGEVVSVATSGEATVVTSSGGTETIEVSAQEPVARVRIFVDNEDGTHTRSDRTVPVRVAMLRIRREPMMKQVSQRVRETLSNKVKDHNESVGDTASKRTTLRSLIAVFERGVGAYRTNPQSVRPTVTSADQWAYARVNSFLYALRNGRFRRGKHDTDLLPASHPMSTKKSAEVKKESYKPTAGMIEAARRGLEWRREHGRGGTAVGVARARDIVNGKNLSARTVLRMFSFFARHAVDSKATGYRSGEPGFPSAGRIAHELWGGDSGKSWSKKIRNQIMNKGEDMDLVKVEQMIEERLSKGYGYEYKEYEDDDYKDDPMTLLLMAYREMIGHAHCHDLLKPLMKLIHMLEMKLVEEEQKEHAEEHAREEEMMEDKPSSGMIDIDMGNKDDDEYGYSRNVTQKVVYRDGEQWCVRSKTGRNFGCYSSRTDAEARLAQIERFSENRIYGATSKELIQWHETLHLKKSVTAHDEIIHNLIEEELEERGFAPPYTLGNVDFKLEMLEKMEGSTPVVKQTEQRFTLGPVYVPGIEDAHQEFTDDETLQKAMWEWVRKGDRRIYLQHSDKVAGEMVEMLTWPFEITTEMTVPNQGVTKYTFPSNTPFMGVIWKEWAWDLVKDGELRGYSIGGQAKRLEADLPSKALV